MERKHISKRTYTTNTKRFAKECADCWSEFNKFTMKRNFYKILHWVARKFRMERLATWSYLKWMHTYADEPFGFWHFAGDYIGMKFSDKVFSVDDVVFNSGENKEE